MALIDEITAAYPLNEASGNAVDDHGSNDLTAVGSPGTAAGKFDNARTFSSGNYFSAMTGFPITDGTPFSLHWWIYPTSTTDYRTLVTWTKAGGTDYVFQVYLDTGSLGVKSYSDVLGGTDPQDGLVINQWNRLAVYFDGIQTFYCRINDDASVIVADGNPTTGDGRLLLGADIGGGYCFIGRMDEVLWFPDYALTETDLDALWNGGAGLLYEDLAGGAAYTITAEGGLYAIAGTLASLEYGRKIAANAGSFTISSIAASLEHGLILAAQSGSFTISATDANFRRGLKIAVDIANFAVSGSPVTFRYTRIMLASDSSFAITGSDATLVHDTLGAYTIVANSGALSISGADASLMATRKINADAGSCAWSGTVAGLHKGYRIGADGGTYLWSGQTANFQTNRVLSAISGTYAISGSAANFLYDSGETVRLPLSFSIMGGYSGMDILEGESGFNISSGNAAFDVE